MQPLPDEVETHGQGREKFLQVQVVHEKNGGDDKDQLSDGYDKPPEPISRGVMRGEGGIL